MSHYRLVLSCYFMSSTHKKGTKGRGNIVTVSKIFKKYQEISVHDVAIGAVSLLGTMSALLGN
jgi:hypothetical protein